MQVAGEGGRAAAKVNDFIGCHHEIDCYGNRKRVASEITISVLT